MAPEAPVPAAAGAERAELTRAIERYLVSDLGAALGLLFPPLQFYVSYLLLRVYFSDERLRPRYRALALIAALINVPMLLLTGVILRTWFLD